MQKGSIPYSCTKASATGLIATSSVVIAVIGFALRNIISDVFSGIALGIDHPYRIGDWIEIGEGSAGRVIQISWRTTRLLTRDGVALIVPNGLIAGHRLINYGAGEQAYRTSLGSRLPRRFPRIGQSGSSLGAPSRLAVTTSGLAPDVLLQDYSEGAAIYAVRFMVPDYGHESCLSRCRRYRGPAERCTMPGSGSREPGAKCC